MAKLMFVMALVATTLMMDPSPLEARPLSNASLRGPYGFRVTKFGTCPNVSAGVGIFTFDGAGNLSGVGTVYESNPGGAGPTVSNPTFQGTYTVNADGTGSLTADIIVSGSVVDSLQLAFVIDNGLTQLEMVDVVLNSLSCASSVVATKQ